VASEDTVQTGTDRLFQAVKRRLECAVAQKLSLCFEATTTETHSAIHVRGLAPSAEEVEDRRSDEIIMTPAFLTFSFFIRNFSFLYCFNVSLMLSKQILNTYNNKCAIL